MLPPFGRVCSLFTVEFGDLIKNGLQKLNTMLKNVGSSVFFNLIGLYYLSYTFDEKLGVDRFLERLHRWFVVMGQTFG